MIRTSRLLIIAFLIVAQLVGPLVHAHSGGGASPGVVHLPGLEGLALQSGSHAQPPSGLAGGHDVIVGLDPGLEVDCVAWLTPDAKDSPALPAARIAIPALRGPPACGPPLPEPLMPPDRIHPAASPRAPPA